MSIIMQFTYIYMEYNFIQFFILSWLKRKGLEVLPLSNSIPPTAWLWRGFSRRKLVPEMEGSPSFLCVSRQSVCRHWVSSDSQTPLGSFPSGSFSHSSELQFLWAGAERDCWQSWDVLRKRKGKEQQWYRGAQQSPKGQESITATTRTTECSSPTPAGSGPGKDSPNLFQGPVLSHLCGGAFFSLSVS